LVLFAATARLAKRPFRSDNINNEYVRKLAKDVAKRGRLYLIATYSSFASRS
jgi:hypothetical protein